MQKRGVLLNKLILFCFILVLSSFVVSAYDANLTFEFREFIHQNETYEQTIFAGESQTYWDVNGTLNISNAGSTPIYDIYILINNTQKITTNFTYLSGRPSSQFSGNPKGDMVVHIPELRVGDFTFLTYGVNNTLVEPILVLNTEYIHGFAPKVFSEENFTINMSIYNNVSALSLTDTIYNINLTMRAWNLTWTTPTRLHNFTFTHLYPYPNSDYGNVTQSSTLLWNWEPSSGDLTEGESQWITFNMSSLLPQYTGTHLALQTKLEYEMAEIVSNLTLVVKNASAKSEINFTKQFMDYYDIPNRMGNWSTQPFFGTPINISVNLTKVSMWVTETLDPNNYTGRFQNYNPNVIVNNTNTWSGSIWKFNFTDGFNDTYPPPIIWMKPEFLLEDGSSGQFNDYYFSQNGNDYHMSYIFIIEGYYLEINKKVTNVDNDTYRLDIWVHNRGHTPTPYNMTVTVYDFVPSDFAAWNFTPGYTSNQSVTGGNFTGMTYKWDLGLNFSGTGASLDANDNLPGGPDEWTAIYYVNGSGDFKVSNLYIVGLDPRKVDGAAGSPLVSIMHSIKNYSYEKFFVIAASMLIIANFATIAAIRFKRKK